MRSVLRSSTRIAFGLVAFLAISCGYPPESMTYAAVQQAQPKRQSWQEKCRRALGTLRKELPGHARHVEALRDPGSVTGTEYWQAAKWFRGASERTDRALRDLGRGTGLPWFYWAEAPVRSPLLALEDVVDGYTSWIAEHEDRTQPQVQTAALKAITESIRPYYARELLTYFAWKTGTLAVEPYEPHAPVAWPSEGSGRVQGLSRTLYRWLKGNATALRWDEEAGRFVTRSNSARSQLREIVFDFFSRGRRS